MAVEAAIRHVGWPPISDDDDIGIGRLWDNHDHAICFGCPGGGGDKAK
jgi:hypothetical protein